MARKTTNTSSPRTKKTPSSSIPPVPSQGGAELADIIPATADVSNNMAPESRTAKTSAPVAINEHSTNQNSAAQQQQPNASIAPAQVSSNQSHDHSDLEEKIRQRAYELYLERHANGHARSGDPHQDWLDAEREVRSRASGRERKLA